MSKKGVFEQAKDTFSLSCNSGAALGHTPLVEVLRNEGTVTGAAALWSLSGLRS